MHEGGKGERSSCSYCKSNPNAQTDHIKQLNTSDAVLEINKIIKQFTLAGATFDTSSVKLT